MKCSDLTFSTYSRSFSEKNNTSLFLKDFISTNRWITKLDLTKLFVYEDKDFLSTAIIEGCIYNPAMEVKYRDAPLYHHSKYTLLNQFSAVRAEARQEDYIKALCQLTDKLITDKNFPKEILKVIMGELLRPYEHFRTAEGFESDGMHIKPLSRYNPAIEEVSEFMGDETPLVPLSGYNPAEEASEING